MKKIIQYSLAFLLSFNAWMCFANTNALVFVDSPEMPIKVGEGSTDIQYTLKNQNDSHALPIFPSILEKSGSLDQNVLERVNIGVDTDCGPAGSFLLPQSTCTLSYQVVKTPEEATQTLVVEYSNQGGDSITSDIQFTLPPTWAYIVNTANSTDTPNLPSSISKCSFDNSTGLFSGCTTVAGGNAFTPIDMAFATVAGTPYAYVTKANYDNTGRLNLCGVAANGDIGPCTQTGNVSGQPYTGLAFYNASNGLYVYIAETGANQVKKCSVNTTGTAIGFVPASNCTNVPGLSIPSPQYITIKSLGSTTYAYIGTLNTGSNPNKNMQKCTVDHVTGNLSNCGPAISFPFPYSLFLTLSTADVAFATINNATYAYVTAPSGVYTCAVSSSTGRLSCPTSASRAFTNPQGIVTTMINGTQYAYVSHSNVTGVSRCVIQNNGSLSCLDSGASFVNPHGLTIQ
jgi:hypothetical protein